MSCNFLLFNHAGIWQTYLYTHLNKTPASPVQLIHQRITSEPPSSPSHLLHLLTISTVALISFASDPILLSSPHTELLLLLVFILLLSWTPNGAKQQRQCRFDPGWIYCRFWGFHPLTKFGHCSSSRNEAIRVLIISLTFFRESASSSGAFQAIMHGVKSTIYCTI